MALAYPYEMHPELVGWSVTFPDVPEAITCGNTEAECAVMAADALLCALEMYIEDGQPVPPPSPANGRPVVEVVTRAPTSVPA